LQNIKQGTGVAQNNFSDIIVYSVQKKKEIQKSTKKKIE
jgi:hypothetical protein